MQQAHTLPIGTLLENGKYRVDALLGQGGFGITYKATQTSLGRTVVVKEFFMDGKCTRSADGNSVTIQSLGQGDYETYKDRFFEEAKLLAQFGNLPGIVNVIDFFRENNTVYYAMDFVEGETLAQHLHRLPQERMAPAEAAELVSKVALSLAPVHARNVLHRDLKPANIIRQPNGEPVVLDFGAARAFISDRTAVHSVILTPGYAPPEQYNATGKHGPATDIYALGAVLYRLLTGKTPPASPSRFEEEMASPHDLDPNIPPALSEAVVKAMAVRSADRFAGMAELAEALKTGGQASVQPAPVPAVAPPPIEKTQVAADRTVAATQVGTQQATQQATIQQENSTPSKNKPNSSRWLKTGGALLLAVGVGWIISSIPKSYPLPKIHTESVNGVSFNMIEVPGGTFTMGCTAWLGWGCDDSEMPAHQVTLSNYSIGETEVTQALWRAVMGSSPSNFGGCDECPVEQVNWDDAQQFIQKLNGLTGKRYRLPTEAEWEFAARGGNNSQGYKFSGGNNLDEVGWNNDNAGGRTHSVKGKKANELGLYDMSGNVWEWCWDWYGYYTSDSQNNPTGFGTVDDGRVCRSGGWGDEPQGCEVSNRGRLTPDNRIGDRPGNIGFRLASQ